MHLLNHPFSETKFLSSSCTEGKRIGGIHPVPHRKESGLFACKHSFLQDLQWEEKSGNMELYTYRAGEDFKSHISLAPGLR